VTTVALLQELLHRQHGFQRHYAGSVDGCGLKLEADVRRAYYALLRRLIESVREHSQTAQEPRSVIYIGYPCSSSSSFIMTAGIC